MTLFLRQIIKFLEKYDIYKKTFKRKIVANYLENLLVHFDGDW